METQSCGSLHAATTATRGFNSNASHSVVQASLRCSRSHADLAAGGAGDARKWGLWNDGSREQGDPRRGLPEGSEYLSRDVRSAPDSAARDADPHGSVDRPQTSPECNDSSAVEPGGNERAPTRMHSRLFLQSAMDTSVCSPWNCGEEPTPQLIYSGTSRPERRAFASSTTALCVGEAESVRPTTSPWTGASFNRSSGGGILIATESTARDVLQNSSAWSLNRGGRPQSESSGPRRSTLEDNGSEMKLLDESRHYRSGLSDSVGLTIEVPRPRVWGKEHMIAAVAAATGRTGSKTGAKRGTAVISRGGVHVDDRLSKVRNTLQGVAFDAAERAELPLLQ